MKAPVRTYMRAALAATLATAVCAGPALAGPAPSEVNEELIVNTEAFLAAHPDLKWRAEATRAYKRGQYGTAARYLQRAAQFADKPSQAMYAEMLWNGRGMPMDRALAYAWMDLAAERGYIPFLVKREQYWNALDEAERERAVARGQAVYDEYGDAVAKPRHAEAMARSGPRGSTGSRVSAVGRLQVVLPDPTGNWNLATQRGTVSGDQYYRDRYWNPDEYWAWQDRLWRNTSPDQVRGLLPVSDNGHAGR